MSEKEIIDFLVQRRKDLGLSVRALAERMQCAHSTLYQYERRRHSPSIYHFLRWVEALELKVDHIISGDSAHFKIMIRVTG